jgi:cytoskeleton protein RodZ
MTDVADSEIKANPGSLTTPGEMLRKAREKMHLTQDDVARHLLLSKNIILALELDDYTRIAAPTYARGYLRAYAQLVDINVEELFAALARMTPTFAGAGASLQEIDDSKKIVQRYRIVRWFSYIVLLILLLLIVSWIWQRHGSAKGDTLNVATPTATATPISADANNDKPQVVIVSNPEAKAAVAAPNVTQANEAATKANTAPILIPQDHSKALAAPIKPVTKPATGTTSLNINPSSDSVNKTTYTVHAVAPQTVSSAPTLPAENDAEEY